MQTIAKIFGGKVHATDHALNDVAMMAEKPAWLVFIMAVIGVRPVLFKAATANTAFTVLNRQQPVVRFGGNAGSPFAMFGLLLRVKGWVGLGLRPLVLAGLLIFLGLLPFVAASRDLGSHVVSPAASNGLIGLVVGLAALNAGLSVATVGLPGNGQIPFPLLGRAICFFHQRNPSVSNPTTAPLSKESQL